jgi:hypothetical protein
MEHLGYSMMAILGPTATALHGHSMIGLYFSANWCQEKLYTAQRAGGANQLEVDLVSQCREAKATTYYREDMPSLSMWHKADDEAGM